MLKCFCAYLVVLIHVPGISKEVYLFLPLLHIAVPCFFMISGFYMVSEGKLDKKKITRQFKKVIKILFFANLTFAIWTILRCWILSEPFFNIGWNTWNFWIRWLLIGDNICYPFWYLTAYLQALLFLLIFIKIKQIKCLYIMIPLLLLLGVLLNRYSFIWTSYVFETYLSRNGLFCALPCVLVGSFLKIREKNIQTIKADWIIGVTVSSIVLSYIEMLILSVFDIDGSGGDYNLMTYPLALVAITLCVKWPSSAIKWIKRPLIYVGKECSSNIYVYHILVYSMLKTMCSFGINTVPLQNAEFVIILILIATILSRYLNQIFKGLTSLA